MTDCTEVKTVAVAPKTAPADSSSAGSAASWVRMCGEAAVCQTRQGRGEETILWEHLRRLAVEAWIDPARGHVSGWERSGAVGVSLREPTPPCAHRRRCALRVMHRSR